MISVYARADYSMAFRSAQADFDRQSVKKLELAVSPYCQHRVMSAKPECVADGQINLFLARLVWDIVQVTLGIGRLIVNGRRQDALPYHINAEDGLQRPGRAHHV